MLREPEPHITKSGKRLLWTVGILAAVVLLVVSIQACSARSARLAQRQAERPWTEGYETDSGYMQPDHGWAYYWFWHNVFARDVQPTWHRYEPPQGYPQTYRPWMDDTPYRPRPVDYTPAPSSPSQRTGGFSEPRERTSRPSTTAPSGASQRTGGFSSPPSRAPTSSPSQRTGGFSSSPSAPKPSAPSQRSGGFSSTPKSSGSQKSGGFSSRPKK